MCRRETYHPPFGFLAASLAVLLALAPRRPPGRALGAKSPAAPPIVKTRKVAPGLLFTRIVERRLPRRTFT
jgi:hypothetical protein